MNLTDRTFDAIRRQLLADRAAIPRRPDFTRTLAPVLEARPTFNWRAVAAHTWTVSR